MFCFAAEFRSILFPMMEQLQSQADEIVLVDEVQMRVGSFVARFYLSNLSAGMFVSFEIEMAGLWLELLQRMLRFVTMPTSTDLLREGIPETIKNMLFVMAGLHSIDDGELWTGTWRIIDPILPRMRLEIDALLNPKSVETPITADSEHIDPFDVDLESEAAVDEDLLEESINVTEAVQMEQQRSDVVEI